MERYSRTDVNTRAHKDRISRRDRDYEEHRTRQSRSRHKRSEKSSERHRKSKDEDSRMRRDSRKKSSKHKSRKRESCSSSSSSTSTNSSRTSAGSSTDSSSDSTKLLEKLQKQRQKQVEERKRQKELMKATETPEEKRLRRLKKKEIKERRRKERMGWDNDYLHYTNTDNPFGDGNILSTFVWSKKLGKEGLLGVGREELEMRNRYKQEETKRELEKVKKRRQERELERQQREEEMTMLQRGKEAAQLEQWARQEDQFHLEQARLRSRIRIQDGRAKPIDLLAKYISAEEEVDAVEMHEPYTYLRGLQVKDLEDLIEDIKVYKELERGKNLDYWNDITVIVEDELHKLRKLERTEYEVAVGRREGIHESVAKDVTAIFKGKTAAQLEALQQQIQAKITGKPEGVDIGYWESLLSQLKAHMARARLRDRHQENLRKKLEVLIAEQGVARTESEVESSSQVPSEPSAKQEIEPSTSATVEKNENSQSDDDRETNAADDLLSESFCEYESGGYSPAYIPYSQLEPGTIVTQEDDDNQRLEYARQQVLSTGRKIQNVLTAEEQAMHREARKNMGSDEAQFSVESSLEAQIYLWSDKYRPRKPRYFNRVHTGFEWNKYNQTHYDMDNPPPKIVQGYKFNIFYPDLIDKNTTPEYFLRSFCEEPERPKTANLEKPSVLNPELVDKLDMSLLSKELLCDSMTRYRQTRSLAAISGGKTAAATSSCSSSSSSSLLLPSPSSTRRRQSAVVTGDVQPRRTTTWPRDKAPVRHQRRSFEQIYEPRICQMEIGPRSPTESRKTSQEHAPVKRNSDVRRLDDNNNRNGPPKVLSTVKKRNSRTGIPSDLEIFTAVPSTKSAPEPCKTCGRPDQPERFHSHPKGSQVKIKDIPATATTTKPIKNVPVPKSIQKPVALNFRSDKNKNRPEEIEPCEMNSARPSTTTKRGPRTVTCYVCGREFGTASFPIHEPKCMEKWERENNTLPLSQRRPKPQRPTVGIDHTDWNAAAWEQSQEQLVPCAKCGRTFLPERLPIHERSCKATPKSNDSRFERLLTTTDRQTSANARSVGPPTVPCKVCGRNFGTRSIKIHEPQCNRRWQAQNNSTSHRDKPSHHNLQWSATSDQESPPATYSDLSQKKTVTCYICGRDFGTSSIAIHEPQCLKKWHAENDKLSPARRRKEPQKPEVIYIQDPHTGSMVVDQAATEEANWMTHLSQLVPCKRCGRTFNPDRVDIHEKNCKGNR
ncbi:cactin [Odontomachus brunneus]|uniref:cactin n=1 Tax=Odontomachus brunneus TaxID=486640 RepID=UPI0013F25DD2|nr:cactin [Odontomachus brunneus]